MTTLTDAYNDATPGGRGCSMTAARETLGPSGWLELLQLASRPDVEASRLARALHAVGVTITEQTMSRHLRGGCGVCRAQGHFL